MSEQEQTIDLRILLRVFIEHAIIIIVAGVLAAAVGFSLAKFIIPKKYTSEAMMYVENSSTKQETDTVNVNDINAAQKLVNTCQILFKSPDVLAKLSEDLGGEFTPDTLNGMIKIEAINNTEVLKMTVEGKSPEAANTVCKGIVESSISEYHRVIKGGSIETVSAPTLPTSHTFPSATKFALIGGAIGLVLLYGFFLMKELLDTKVKPDDDLAQMYDIPVFAEILDFEMAEKSGYYRYSKYGKYSSYDTDTTKEDKLFADGEDDDDEEDDDDDNEDAREVKSKNGEKKK